MYSFKKITSAVLSMCMLFSPAALGTVPAAAAETASTEITAQESVQGSSILHCFCWSYNTIKENLADIAAAGYKAIQTSPVQAPKDYSPSYTNTKGNWWKLYQPLDLSVATGNSWLGTKEELTELCTEAENYGIKVIVDIVSNHLANNGSVGDGDFINYLHADVSEDLKNSDYFFPNNGKNNSSSRFQMTHGHLGMPELNTANSYVQQKALNLLKECVDCGVDGFRFDTAKHIELPDDDEGTRSDFWPTVINGINDYKDGLFIYGEILGEAYSSYYTKKYLTYMDLTDDYTCYLARQAVKNKDSQSLASGYYQKNISADQAVLWAESHDTYMNEDGNSKDDTLDTIVKTWAMVNSRANATSLFFVRPGDMGTAGTDTTWKSTPVAEVNKFKNIFDTQSEYLSYNTTYKAAYNERGTKGMVISKTNGGGSVSLTVHKLSDGTYLDHVTNTNFTVSNGVITGTVDSSGVAVIYNEGDTEGEYITADTLYMIPEYSKWSLGNERYAMYLYNYKKNVWVDMEYTGSDNTYRADVPDGKWTGVIFCRMDGSTTENSWDNKWNQTVDLFPTGDNNIFTVTAKDTTNTSKYTGNWSVYGAHEHSYGSPSWTWSSDYSSASATFTCSGCSDTQTVNAVITSETTGTTTTYTATATFNGSSYSDTRTDSQTDNGKVYLLPNSNWNESSARFAVYFYGGEGTPTWVDMTACCDSTHYEASIPDGNWTNLIFVRMNPAFSENRWNTSSSENPKRVWNQTNDLTVNTDQCYTIADGAWSKGDGSWSDYTPTHSYSAPVWTWSDDHSSATAAFTCNCNSNNQTLNAAVSKTYSETGAVCTATVSFNGNTYTDTQTEEYKEVLGYSLTLGGDIGMNFYLNIPDADVADNKVSVKFNWFDKEETVNLTTDNKQADNLYTATCEVAPAEMTYDVTMTVTNGTESEVQQQTFSAKQYAQKILTDEKVIANYKADETAKGRDGETRYNQLKTLVQNMLDYGARAQVRFNRNTEALANSGTYYNSSEVTLNNELEDMETNLSSYGLQYEGSTVVYLSKTSLRHYYTITNQSLFDSFKNTIKIDGNNVSYGERDNMIYFEVENIAAPMLDNRYCLTIGSNSYNYSVLDYVQKLLASSQNEAAKELGKATVRYNAAADIYFAA